MRHTYGRCNWELPGGASEQDESIVETAVREVVEETGLRVEPDALSGVYYTADTDAHHFVFRCSVIEGEPVPSSPEISDCAYWLLDDLPRPISDFTVRRIEDAASTRAFPLPAVVPARVWLD